ncbi:hypothetical protein EB796_002871 [Bugula neritina]|uniref:Innexin n=1 Tax=Bugula neritina TaxID=10212 RepID=A0A7J7KL45_BUGNE|nr:hypothetical protein EB796_002871 [Bugula neritina]
MRKPGKPLGVGKRFGSFLLPMYLIVKLLYIANAIGLIFLMDKFLGIDFVNYGSDIVKSVQDSDYKMPSRFPYVTLCDFFIRRTGHNVQRYTIHCVLPANIFNEKCFMFLWFWLVFVAAASTIGLILWLFTACSGVNMSFTKKYLGIMGRLDNRDRDTDHLLHSFVHEYLRQDGIFCMRLVIKNTNDAIGGEIFAACWDHFLLSRKPPPTFEPYASPTKLLRQSKIEQAL